MPDFKDNGDLLRPKEVQSNQSGLYFLYNEEKELMYIGFARNLRQGVLFKATNIWCGDIDIQHNFKFAKYIELPDDKNVEDYKVIYINILKPKLNRLHVFTYETEYFNGKYNKRYTEENQRKIQEEINKTYEDIIL